MSFKRELGSLQGGLLFWISCCCRCSPEVEGPELSIGSADGSSDFYKRKRKKVNLGIF
jgi:hypothetical protein